VDSREAAPGEEDAMKTIAVRLIKIALIVILILALGAGCAPGGGSALPVADRSLGGIPSGYADLNGLRMYYEIRAPAGRWC
jgi:hypothetical protein